VSHGSSNPVSHATQTAGELAHLAVPAPFLASSLAARYLARRYKLIEYSGYEMFG